MHFELWKLGKYYNTTNLFFMQGDCFEKFKWICLKLFNLIYGVTENSIKWLIAQRKRNW